MVLARTKTTTVLLLLVVATTLCNVMSSSSSRPYYHDQVAEGFWKGEGEGEEHLRKRRQQWKRKEPDMIHIHSVFAQHSAEKQKKNQKTTTTQQNHHDRRLDGDDDVMWTVWGETIEGSIQGGQFGSSLAISANGMVVAGGAPFATITSTSNNNAVLDTAAAESLAIQNNGQVLLHQFVKGQWTSAGHIDGTPGQEENFGSSIDLSWDGTKLVVGAPKAPNGGLARVYQYDVDTETWSKQQDLTVPSLTGDPRVAEKVAMNADGDVICLGAPKADNDRGMVRVFQYSGGTWSPMGQDIYGNAQGDAGGFSIDLSANGLIVAVGSPTHKVGDQIMAGEVRIFRYSEEDQTWNKLGQNITGTVAGYQLGYALSLSADGLRIAIGIPRKSNDSTSPNKGAVEIYQYSGSNDRWAKVGNTIYGGHSNDILGASLSLSAAGNDISVLKVVGKQVGYYSLIDDQWKQVGNTIKEDITPKRVTMSADGNKIVVGDLDSTVNGLIQVYSFADKLYDITLVNVEAMFADEDDFKEVPEVELTYVNSAPAGTGYYKLQILDPACTTIDTTFAITPVLNANGIVPETNPGSSDIHAMVDIDTLLIKDTEYFEEGTDLDAGKIRFCAKIDFYDQQDQSVATERSKITLQLDQTARWELDGVDGAANAPHETIHYVSFDYEIIAYFCNDDNKEISPAPLFPGQSIQACVRTPVGSEVEVLDLRAVVFKNDLVPLLTIYVVDEDGNPTNDKTSVTCNDGICNLETVAFSDLYEYDVDDNGTLEDVSEGVRLQGKAVLGFTTGDIGRLLYRVETPSLNGEDKEQSNGGTTTTVLDTDENPNAEMQANTDEDLREVIGAENQMAETNFAVNVALQKPPKKVRDMPSATSTSSPIPSICLAVAILAAAIAM